MTDETMRLLLQASKIMDIEQLELVRDLAKLTRINALEEAAKVAKGDEASATEYYRGRVHAAAAIRALKDKAQ